MVGENDVSSWQLSTPMANAHWHSMPSGPEASVPHTPKQRITLGTKLPVFRFESLI